MTLILEVSGNSLLAIKFVHAIFGAGHALLLGLIGTKVMGRRAGLATGLLAAAYGPFIAVESMILRDGLGLFLAAASLYLVLRALERTTGSNPTGGWTAWLGAGLVLGIGGLVKETSTVLFGCAWLWSWAHSLRGRDPLPRRIPWLLLSGFLVALLPFVVRNVMVGLFPSSKLLRSERWTFRLPRRSS